MEMLVKIQYLKDRIGNIYFGIKYLPYELKDILNIFKNYHKNNDNLKLLIHNQQKRDNNYYHTTILTVFEYDKVKDLVENYVGLYANIKIVGIGKAIDDKNNNETHFAILKCEELQKLRNKLGFNNKDFHITLGFNKKDVFTKPKNELSKYIKI